MKITLSKSQWEEMGKKAGWMKNAFAPTNFSEVSLGPTPSGETCAQLGSDKYDFEALTKMEIRAYANQLRRMFPQIPQGVSYKAQRNIHDFGTYYELAIKFDENNDQASDYAFMVENNIPENWDEQAKQELEKQNYFTELAKGGVK